MFCACTCLKKSDPTRFPPQVVSLLFSFGTLSRVIDFSCLVVAHTNTHCCVCAATILVACATAARSLGSLSPPMTRLTLRQREELVELHLQGLPISAIVRRTGHDHKTVLQWARRFAAEASLLDRVRTGRPVTRMTRRMVNSIRHLVKDKRVSQPDGLLLRFALAALQHRLARSQR